MMHKVFLALGSNMGSREDYLLDAVNRISHINGTSLIDISSIYETNPVGYADQDRFLNMAVYIQTVLTPLKLLDELQNIENSLKRTREIRWGPRTIDIDILLYDDEKIEHPRLVVPHPRMFERAFVLIPLRDIYNKVDINTENISRLIENCGDKEGVKLYKEWTMKKG